MRFTILGTIRHIRPNLTVPSCRSVRDYQRNEANALQPNEHRVLFRLFDTLSRTWDLGLTAFGGPPVHFRIVHHRFVRCEGDKVPWIDEQTYSELFAVCQALPGPASTKMLFCLIQLHAGLVPATCGFLVWSLPGAIGMYLLSLGVARIGTTLPGPVYALLSGLNASTVGIIALASTELASKAITDRLTRILVIGGACAGLCYSALWYFPTIMFVGGLTTVVWDVWMSRAIGKFRAKLHQRRLDEEQEPQETQISTSITLDEDTNQQGATQRRSLPARSAHSIHQPQNTTPPSRSPAGHGIMAWQSITIIVCFFTSFAAVMIARAVIPSSPLVLDLFANMYLAGTIIFGGGPVVIPLLREYVVQPGWVSPRDFLIGLAIIQAFPGPNFNFAVYLSALAVQSTHYPSALGALLGFLGIFVPGVVLALAVQGLWRVLRTKPVVVSTLRGINATAVGLIFTAVYRLWELGYLTPSRNHGKSLALEPWWVVVAAVTYSSSAWFSVPPAAAILGGAVLGLLWYAAVGHRML